MRIVLIGFLMCVVAQLSAPAWAWNEAGHRIIAAAAAQQMPPALRRSIKSALQAHPRYQQDIAKFRPRRLAGLDEFAWLLGQAAQWPDHARRFDNARFYQREALVERFHRGRWHYVNLPVYLNRSDRTLRIKDPRRSLDPDAQRNVLEVLAFLREELGSADATPAEQGLWLSWALHLIADIHQPLHTSALFSRDRWPRGDRGGNEIKLTGTGRKGRLDSLHYFWDVSLSNRRRPAEVSALAATLNAQELPAPGPEETSPLLWVREGQKIANQFVYDPLRAQLRRSPEVRISKSYTQRAHAIALQQAALAARRTALWLTEAFAAVDADQE